MTNNLKNNQPKNTQSQSTQPKNTQSQSTQPQNNSKKESKTMSNFTNFLPSLFHTSVKLLPFGLYVSAILESILFNDIRGFFIFIGLIFNDMINIGYAYMMNQDKNKNCAVIVNWYTDDYFVLSTPHTQYIAFISSFLLTSMYFKKIFNYAVFSIFMTILGITIWSRISVGCSDMLDAGYNLVFGFFRGIIYYLIVKDYYEPDELEPEKHWIENVIRKYLPTSDADDLA